jgi:hypothetical protein
MSLEDLGNIGEFVAAVGVIVSLIYLAMQIRQNTESVRANTSHAVSSSFTEWGRRLLDRDLFCIWREGRGDLQSLSPEERDRFLMMAQIQFRNYEDAFHQFQRSLLEAEVWESRRTAMLEYFFEPGIQDWWSRRKNTFSRSFREFLDQQRPTE